MPSEKTWTTINVSLALISILLLLTLFGVELPTLGQAQYALNKDEPLCYLDLQGELTQYNNLDRCCLEARKQSLCIRNVLIKDNLKLDWQCDAGSGNGYRLNTKAFLYCKQQPYW